MLSVVVDLKTLEVQFIRDMDRMDRVLKRAKALEIQAEKLGMLAQSKEFYVKCSEVLEYGKTQ